MSDLSWLNPTPHAIAVYASRPLSPVAAQHSLPSGRYSLLGPDFHRLDRTSLRLAHSFDHLVGTGDEGRPFHSITRPNRLCSWFVGLRDLKMRNILKGDGLRKMPPARGLPWCRSCAGLRRRTRFPMLSPLPPTRARD